MDAALKDQVIQKLLPLTTQRSIPGLSDSGDPNDPFKIWVLLYYPDSLKISASKLYTLLDKLRSCPDQDLCMNQCEWTLSARVNSQSDTTTQTEQKDSTTEDTDQPLTDMPAYCKERPMPTEFFCITAPVKDTANVITTDSCHYVRCYTETVIVDLRYSGFNQQSDSLLDSIADRVRSLVMTTLGIPDDPKTAKYRVYVLKPQHQNRRGVSPRDSICGCDDEVDLVVPERKKPALEEEPSN